MKAGKSLTTSHKESKQISLEQYNRQEGRKRRRRKNKDKHEKIDPRYVRFTLDPFLEEF